MNPEECSLFNRCDAPLCPLDIDIHKRIWYVGEDVCFSPKHGKHRWIKKQRKFNRKTPNKYLDREITYQEIYDVSRPMNLTDEQKVKRSERLSLMRASKLLSN